MISSPQAMMHSGRAEFEAKRPKFYLMAAGQYLNQSGKHLQTGTLYAWTGSMEQARNCRRTSPAAAGCRTVNVRSIVPTPIQTEEA